MVHVVYLDKKSKKKEFIQSGEKTMVIRGATGRKLPYGHVFKGDMLYFLENDGLSRIELQARVKEVFYSEKLTEEESKRMIEQHKNKLNLTPSQIKRWSGKRYLCIVEFEEVTEIEVMYLDRQKNMDDWITVLELHSIIK